MCGIFGYIGKKDAIEVILNGLKELEYRGYDSAGIALSDGQIRVYKSVGRVETLEKKLVSCNLRDLHCGIGHTRWATHGEVNEENCHPHLSFDGKIAVVHNGTVENWRELRKLLELNGIKPVGETDSELLAHLIAVEYETKSLYNAVFDALKIVNGSYAIAVIARDRFEIIAARKNSPLIIGKDSDGIYISSDIPALYGCKEVYAMMENDIASVNRDEVNFYNDGKAVERAAVYPDELNEETGLNGYDYYMHKEIFEIPKAVSDTYKSVIARIESDDKICKKIEDCDKIFFVGCGTAFHAGAGAAYMFEKYLKLPCRSFLASEFVYFPPVMDEKTLCFFITQSGETADTLKALELASINGCQTIALTNVKNSSICFRGCDMIYTAAGRETAVASTKAYSAQLTAFYAVLQIILMRKNGRSPLKSYDAITDIEMYIRMVIAETDKKMKRRAESFRQDENVFFIGRGPDCITACEGALKLKETAELACEALAAGELKHGTLSLIEKGVKVIVIATQNEIRDKIQLVIAETRARGAEVTVISQFGELKELCDDFIAIPEVDDAIISVFSVIPLQLLAYHISVALGHSPDKPRNLAKSVTVE